MIFYRRISDIHLNHLSILRETSVFTLSPERKKKL